MDERVDGRPRTDVRALTDEVLAELQAVLHAVDPDAVIGLLDSLESARRVFYAAQGRSGLVARASAMRWMHLGRTVYVAGQTLTPAIAEGDLLVCLSAGGRTRTTLHHAATARAAGARVVALISRPDSPLADAADVVVEVPARTTVRSVQHAGSLFEQACLVLGDLLCLAHQRQHGIADPELDRRHANLL
jgi:6-phospho-3-hexuloisomerase